MDQFRFLALRDEMHVDLMGVPFELRPDMPNEGLSASRDGLSHSPRVEKRLIELAAKEGERMVLPDLVPKTHNAMVLAELGRDRGEDVFWPLHLDIFREYFVAGRDIGNRAVLIPVGLRHGIPESEMVEAWDSGRYDERLHEFRHLALHLGIKETPSALICNELLIGSRPYEILRAAVQRCLVRPSTIDHAE
ncbi:DsbA family protein [Coriobacteriia bacterium Es71-Z0120]|uniref:DsbA family oxidoreductase n=1 Tax=Parvivirga hydrogeniphila TaxID=2939460 RepID=UPI002260C3FC|nr:DsbA family protein [Parvivirga hydrogeniphila]MCL4078340.1 DsbA family protein [Parvivirga hydrogeniphila]